MKCSSINTFMKCPYPAYAIITVISLLSLSFYRGNNSISRGYYPQAKKKCE